MQNVAAFWALGLALTFPAAAGSAAAGDPVLAAMQDELSRSSSKLARAGTAPLYYLAYETTDVKEFRLGASLGALESDSFQASRYLDTDVRVGARQFDNTHELKGRGSWMGDAGRSRDRVPAETDAAALRAALWQSTDAAFKAALERYTKVKTNRAVTAEEEDRSPDFSEEGPAARHEDEADFPVLDKDLWRSRLKELSALFKTHPFIYDSGVGLEVRLADRRFVSSEGARLRTGNLYIRLSYQLISRTTDGMDIYRSRSYDGDRLSDLPSDETLRGDIARSVAELKALRSAPLVEPYAGPVILKSRAAAVFFHEIFGHRVEGQRQKRESEGQTFTKKLGQPVVSSFISVQDDPTLDRYRGTFLRGAYRYDDEGVPAQRATLVEGGLLRGFLLNRMPIKGFPRSNGHGRREPGHATVARMGNTIVEASRTVPYAELRRLLLEELARQKKPFGLVFDDISGGFTTTGRGGVQAFKVQPLLVYKVYADGRPDETVRGVDIVGTPIASFMKILAAGDDPAVFNGTCGAESGGVPVSAVSPSLLISEMEVEKVSKSQAKPPILPPPYGDKP
ncbi:MAG: peptidase U62 [Elusimicrobia bacterium]|nr:peptidase U62 [Elusimicrobiota bacterium]